MVKTKILRKSKPRFVRLGASRKRIDENTWRKPKGMHGRVKKLLGHNKGAAPDIGYGSPKSIRGKHTSGLEIVEIKNLNDLERVDPKTQIIKIANVGKKKKIAIVEEALKRKIKISNLRKPEEYLEKNKLNNKSKSKAGKSKDSTKSDKEVSKK
jgi:large subunit ribosomal protein L32e